MSEETRQQWAKALASPLLDKDKLAIFLEFDQAEGIRVIIELRDMFQLEIREILERLTEATSQHDDSTIRRCLHNLTGSAGNLGALRLSGACSYLYQAARENDFRPLRDHIDELDQLFSDTCQALGEMIKEINRDQEARPNVN